MSLRESDFDCPHTPDAAAYVLGALQEGELRDYRAHLDGCAQCRAEVAALQPVVDELPASAAPARAPDALRERILSTVRSEAALLHAAGGDADRPPPKRARRPRRRFAIGGALAGAGALAVVLALVLSTGSGGGERVFQARISAGAPGAAATLRQRDGRAELLVSHMPPPGAGRVYEVWLSRGAGDAQPTSALFDVTDAGRGATAVAGDLRGIREVMVTSEPQGGSSRPTRQPLIRIALSS
jgi:anti-sigma-K factor RskA